jgi:hypothetical protein
MAKAHLVELFRRLLFTPWPRAENVPLLARFPWD